MLRHVAAGLWLNPACFPLTAAAVEAQSRPAAAFAHAIGEVPGPAHMKGPDVSAGSPDRTVAPAGTSPAPGGDSKD